MANIARGGQNIARARLMSRRTWRRSRETPSVRQPPRPLRSNGVVWTVAVANSPALTVQSWTVALGESGGAGEQSATPIAQQLSSTTSFHVVPADCSGRRWLHQSIIIFACAASCCLESAVTSCYNVSITSASLQQTGSAIQNDYFQKLPNRARQAAHSLFLRVVSSALLGATASVRHDRA